MPAITVHINSFQKLSWLEFSEEFISRNLTIYRIKISSFSPLIPNLFSLLQPDEVSRAGRYHQEKDRHRFIISRAIQRIILGKYLNINPGDILFTIGSNKKPRLAPSKNVNYNVSHSGNYVLLAVSAHETGIDVEKIETGFQYQDILRSNFNENEGIYIKQSLNSYVNFYTLWTRKEALLKATAKGIDQNFYQVPALDGIHYLEGSVIGSTENWAVSSFSIDDGYLGAVAYDSKLTPEQIRFCGVDIKLINNF